MGSNESDACVFYKKTMQTKLRLTRSCCVGGMGGGGGGLALDAMTYKIFVQKLVSFFQWSIEKERPLYSEYRECVRHSCDVSVSVTSLVSRTADSV